jgi:hypothetical protein
VERLYSRLCFWVGSPKPGGLSQDDTSLALAALEE